MATEERKVRIRRCVKREKRIAVPEWEYETYKHLINTCPAMVSDDYTPYEWVCIEWETIERDANAPDLWVYLFDPTDTPLLTIMNRTDNETDGA